MFIMVDLDKTFLKIDINWLLFKHVLANDFFFALKLVFFYFFYGPAKVKSLLAPYLSFFNIDVFVNKKVLHFLELQKDAKIVLATGAFESVATQIVARFNIFSDCISSTGVYNCVGENKLKKITSFTENQPFFYIGDSVQDFPIWEAADKIGVVNPSDKVLKKIKSLNKEFIAFFD